MDNQEIILVVENHNQLSSLLSEHGYKVKVTTSLETTQQAARKIQPDLIILNTIMADFDGYYLCEQIKAETEISDIAVFFCDPDNNTSAKVKAILIGATEYFSYPPIWEELSARINNQFKLSKRQKQLKQENLRQQQQILEWEILAQSLFEGDNALATTTSNQEDLQQLLNHIPFLAWTTDKQGNYKFLNQAWSTLTSSLPQIGQPWGDAIHPEDKEKIVGEFFFAFQEHKPFTGEYRVFANDVEERWVIDQGQPRFNFQGELLGYFGFVFDITECKIKQLILEKTKKALEKQTYQAELIKKITQQMRDSINIQTICQTAALSIGESLNVSRCLILTYAEQLIPPVLPVAEYKQDKIKTALWADLSIKNNYLAAPILIEDAPYVSKDVYQDHNLESYQSWAVDLQIKSLIMVRTSYQDKINGLITLHQCDYFRDWTTEEIDLLELVAKQLAIAIAHAQMLEKEKARNLAISKKNKQLLTEITQRQKIEKQLRDSEERWQLAVKGTKDGIFDFNLLSGEVFYSTRWKTMLGYTEAEIGTSQKEWLDRIHPEDAPLVLETERAHLEGKTPYFEQEYRLKCADGSYKWILGRGQAIWDKQGKAIRLLGSHIDITQRKEIEQALKESEARYRDMIESQEQVLSCCWRPDMTLTFVNESYAKFFGKSSQDLIGTNFLELVVDENNSHDKIKNTVNLMISQKIPTSYEHNEISARGEKRWFCWTNQPVFDDQGSLIEFHSHGVDVSAQKKREDALSLIVQETINITGENFCRAGVRYLAESLSVSYSFICEVVKPENQKLRPRVFWDGQDYSSPQEKSLHSIDKTPWRQTCDQGVYYLKDSLEFVVANNSPLNCLKAVSYWGMALRDSQGFIMGILGVMDTKPLHLSADQEMIVKIFAGRLGAELERQSAEEALKRRVEKEKLFSTISRSLIDEDLDSAMSLAVQLIGEYFGSDRCYVFQYQPRGLLMMTHEWCQPEIPSKISLSQNFYLQSCGLLLKELLQKDFLFIKNVDELPDYYEQEKSFLAEHSLKSFALVPIKQMSVTVGFIGLEGVKGLLYLQEEDLELINFIGNFLGNAFERKQAQNKLKASQQKLSFLVQQAPLAIIEMNTNQQIISWNPAAEAIFGYEEFEIIERQLIDILVPEHLRDKIKQIYQELFISRKRKLFISENLSKDGKTIICEWYITPLINNQGNLLGIACIAVNITQRKRTELALKQAKESAEAASLAKGNFLACMSHELKTPLHSILGFSQVLTEDLTLGEKQRENIKIINKCGKHLLDLINNLLSRSKIEAGKVELVEKLFELPELLRSLQEMLKIKIKEKGLALILEYDPNLPQYVINDEVKLRQVLINLLQNSIKFTHKGSVILRVKMRPEKQVLLFEVEDTGIGVAPEDLSNLFEPFSQTFRGSQYSDGTGLGLTISREYIHLMGGEISVQSNLGAGSIFSFNIPLKKQPKDQALFSQATKAQTNHRVLIVDDQQEQRQSLTRFLQGLPLEIKEINSGQQALYLCKNWNPELIFIDLDMPGMDGYQTTYLIRNESLSLRPIIIALSDNATDDVTMAIAGVGCDDFITKPFSGRKVLDKIYNYLCLSSTDIKLPANAYVNTNTLVFKPLIKQDLKAMPSSWIKQLHLAALEINDQEILDLIKLIPPQETSLINGLTELVKNFRVDLIIDLTS